jgi:hypothetical protein
VWNGLNLGEGKGQVKDCCKPGNEFHHQLTDNHLLKTESNQRRKFLTNTAVFAWNRLILVHFHIKFEIFLVFLNLCSKTQCGISLYTFM